MNKFLIGAAAVLFAIGNSQIQAQQLLISPGFEVPEGIPEVEGWILDESISGSTSNTLNTAQLAGGAHEGTRSLLLRAFVGNGVLDPNQGNFDSDFPGDVDGLDFLQWQLGNSPTPLSQADLTTWENNYGRVAGLQTNAVLSQTVDANPSTEYTFSGFANWEDNYSGGASPLDAGSPLGAVATPTTNSIHIEFLNSGGAVIDSESYDLVADGGQFNDAFTWLQHSITRTSPVGTTQVRVSADAKNMVYNVDPLQGARYDTFSLTDTSDPNAQLLTNAGLDLADPTALEFWDIFEIPAGCCGGSVLRSNAGQLFAAHEGTRGVWLSPFFGAHPIFEAVPVTGLMSQTVSAVAGGTYDFSGWFKFEGNYSGGVDTIDAGSPGFFAGQASPTETLIVVEFLDINGTVINPIIDFDPNGVSLIDPNSPNIIDIRAERQAQCGGNANDQTCGEAGANGLLGWTEHSLSGIVAPAGAVSARLTAGMLNGVFNIDPAQSAFFDDFTLTQVSPLSAATVVPEPATVVSLALGVLLFGTRRNKRRNSI